MAKSDVCIEMAWMPTDHSVRSASLKVREGLSIEACLVLLSLPLNGWMASRHGRSVALQAGVCAGDRIVLCRPLRIDPKQARVRRALRNR